MAFKEGEKVLITYSSPLILLPTGQVVSAPIEWDAENLGISVTLPPSAHPLLVVFGVGAKIPENISSLFPSLKIKSKGGKIEVSSSEESGGEGKEPKQKRRGIKFTEAITQAEAAVTAKKPEKPEESIKKPTETKPTKPSEKQPSEVKEAKPSKVYKVFFFFLPLSLCLSFGFNPPSPRKKLDFL